jgi:hypothetical protein
MDLTAHDIDERARDRKAKSEAERLDLLVRTLEFAREHTAPQPAENLVASA